MLASASLVTEEALDPEEPLSIFRRLLLPGAERQERPLLNDSPLSWSGNDSPIRGNEGLINLAPSKDINIRPRVVFGGEGRLAERSRQKRETAQNILIAAKGNGSRNC